MPKLWNRMATPIAVSSDRVKDLLHRRRDQQIAREVAAITNALPRGSGPQVSIFQRTFYDERGEVFFAGGAERYVIDLSRILAQLGRRVLLIQKGRADGGVWTRSDHGLDVVGVPAADADEFARIVHRLARPTLSIYSGAVSWGTRLHHPNILISHGVTWDTYTRDARPGELYDALVRETDLLVSVDTNTLSWLRSTFSKTLRQRGLAVRYVPNYVDTALYRPRPATQPGRTRILFPRRLCPERGYWLASAVAERTLERHAHVEMGFVGVAHDPAIVADVQRLRDRFPDRVWHRAVGPDEMPQIYPDADVTLIPTLHGEGTSLSCLEAMACGNVVIATNVGGLPNLIIHRYNGLLVNPDAEELSAAVETVLADGPLAAALAANAVEVAQAFSKERWEAQWRSVLERTRT